jgi:hypothetical protein
MIKVIYDMVIKQSDPGPTATDESVSRTGITAREKAALCANNCSVIMSRAMRRGFVLKLFRGYVSVYILSIIASAFRHR